MQTDLRAVFHGHVNVLVFLLAVAHGDVLMPAQPRRLYGPAYNLFELGRL